MDLGMAAPAPAPDQHSRLQEAADLFNAQLFGGELSPVYLTLQHKPGCYGYFSPDRFRAANGALISSIALDSVTAVDRPLIELLSTLVHEQCHQLIYERSGCKSTGAHGPAWRQAMQRCGLPPLQVGATWKKATHRIDPAGLFAEVFSAEREQLQALPWQERHGKTARSRGTDRVKFTCPSCQQNAWGRPAAELLCGSCSRPAALVRMIGTHDHGSRPGAPGAGGNEPEPTNAPGLPVWTDELGREVRVHTGIDHPPATAAEASAVMSHGLAANGHADLWQQWHGEPDSELLKAIYRIRARQTHPDAGGSTEAFKMVQIAYVWLKKLCA
jgi:hypothetical protein